MSSVSERERGLVVDLLLSRISEDSFHREYPIERGEASSVGLAMLRRACVERDPVGVEFGLYLGHRFGISADYLDVLLVLAAADWHERHEDVVDGLAQLKAPASVDALYHTALAEHPYRNYDDASALGVKAVRAIGGIETPEALARLEQLLHSEHAALKDQARKELARMANGGKSDALRVAAQSALQPSVTETEV